MQACEMEKNVRKFQMCYSWLKDSNYETVFPTDHYKKDFVLQRQQSNHQGRHFVKFGRGVAW